LRFSIADLRFERKFSTHLSSTKSAIENPKSKIIYRGVKIMRGFLLRLAVGFLTLVIGLGIAAVFGANLRPNFTRARTYSYRVMPPAPRVDYDDEFYRGRSCPQHRHEGKLIVQPRFDTPIDTPLDVPSQSDAVKPVKPIPAQPRARF